KKISAVRREAVDEPTLFESLDAMGEAGGHDKAVAGRQHGGHLANGHLEPAFGDIASLNMRVAVLPALATRFEREFHHHQLVGVKQHAPAVAVRRRGPFALALPAEDIAFGHPDLPSAG